MKFAASQTKEFTQCPAGNHVAICNLVADFGLQPGSDMYPSPKHQVYIRFEIPGERITYKKDDADVEGPMSIGRTFTASMNEKANLRLFIEGWFGKKFPTDEVAADFDLQKLLGQKCLVNVTHNTKGGKTYANLSAATPLPKGMADTSKQENESVFFDLTGDSKVMGKAFDKLPKWMQAKVEGRIQPEREQKAPAKSDEPFFSDDIPF